jgi:hypothetical protein
MSDAVIAAARKAWADATAVAAGGRAWRAVRLDFPGPLTVLGGVRETDGGRAVLFEASIENAPQPHARFEADGISMIEERSYREGIYRIGVTLERPDLDTIFGLVAADLVEAAAASQSVIAAIAALFARLAAWQAFLRARRAGLGQEAVTGLVGELLVLRRLANIAGWPVAVAAWQGPTGGLHDFSLRGIGIETKTSSGVASLIRVTTLDQFDDAGLSALLLAHVRLAEAGSGFHLPGLVAELAGELRSASPGSLRQFRDCLLTAGYADADADLYSAQIFQTVSERFYRIGSTFPRLVRAGTPHGIAEVSYALDVRSLQPHLLEESDAAVVMSQMGD